MSVKKFVLAVLVSMLLLSAMVSEFLLSKSITNGYVTLTITGEVDGTPFEGSNSIRVIFPPTWRKGYKR